MAGLWRDLTNTGQHYGVNPTVFAVLYLAHHPLFWGTVAWIAVRARMRLVVWPHSILAAAFWLTPWIYVLLSARHVPLWVIAGLFCAVVFGAYHAVLDIRKKIKHQTEENVPAAEISSPPSQ